MNKKLWISLTKSIVVFHSLVLITESTYADLASVPPIFEATKQSNQAQIELLITKARATIRSRQLTAPARNNAVYYVNKLLTLSPGDKRGQALLTEVCDTYVELAYKSLKKNETESAQQFHDKAIEVTRPHKIDYDYKMLAELQGEIDLLKLTLRRTKLSKLKSSIGRPSLKAVSPVKIENNNKKELHQVTEQQQQPIEYSKVVLDSPFVNKSSIQKQQTITQLQQKKSTSDQFDPEQIVVIVNTLNNLSSITLNDLKSLYKSRHTSWQNGERVILYLPSANSKEGRWLARKVFNKPSYTDVQQFYMHQLNRHVINNMPRITKNAVLHVSTITGGIAIVKAGAVGKEASIKLLPIQGM
jgi:hypothetical protein